MDQAAIELVAGKAEGEPQWRELDGGRLPRLIHGLLAFAIVALLGFGAGLSVGERSSGSAVGAVSTRSLTPAVTLKRLGGACGSVPEGAWRTQLCPSPGTGSARR